MASGNVTRHRKLHDLEAHAAALSKRVSVPVAVAAGLAFHFFFVLALFPLALDLAPVGCAEF
jgi:hypothetical protein